MRNAIILTVVAAVLGLVGTVLVLSRDAGAIVAYVYLLFGVAALILLGMGAIWVIRRGVKEGLQDAKRERP